MKFPMSVTELIDGLPHRPPMIWIDEVTAVSAEHGEARVRIKKDAAYFDSNGVRPSAMIEWIAQTYGDIAVCQYLSSGQPVRAKRAFLAAVKDATMTTMDLKVDDLVTIKIDQIRPMGPLTMLRGRVFHEDRLLGEANLRLFQEL